ncbi:MAG: hypothetical protein R3F61_08900 [Myxococcota bacterium]
MNLTRLALSLVLLCAACKKKDGTDTDADTDPVVDTDTDVVDTCGDGVVDEGEECDLAAGNGPSANCLEGCVAAQTQHVVLTAAEISPANLDAQVVTDAGAPAGAGAWAPADSDLGGDGLAKFELNIPLYDFTGDLTPEQFQAIEQSPYQPPTPWLAEIHLSEIAQISFWTNTPATESGSPYFLVLYTQRDGIDDTDWYGYRLTAVPSSARNVVAPADTWVQWTVSGTENVLAFADQPTIGTFTGPALPTLGELQAGAFDWSQIDPEYPSTSVSYGDELMRFVSIQTGSGTDTTGTDAALDLIEIRLTDGRGVVIDLEP